MGPSGDQYDVFLSCHWRDHDAAERLAHALDTRGLRVFFDRWYLRLGLPWPQALEQALERCHAVAVCVGPEGMGPWQMREQFLALDRQVREEKGGKSFPVIPVVLPGADLPLGFLKLNTWVTLRSGVDDELAFEAITRAARGLSPEVVRARPAVCPYRGLQFFREEDSPFFFGREAFSARLIQELEQKSFLAVVGASGSGKSSVVRAGLVPHLRKGADGHVWEVLALTPGSRPLRALAAALVPTLEPKLTGVDRLAKLGKLAENFATKTISLQDAVQECLETQRGTDRLLLFVDQWEELYTACKDEEARRWFIDELLTAATDTPVRVVLALRLDFYDRALATQATLLVERGQSEDAMLRAATLAIESWRREPNADAYAVAMKLLEWSPVRRIEADPGSRTSPGVLLSPDGRFLVINDCIPTRLIEIADGRELMRIKDEDTFATRICPQIQFSPDSSFLRFNERLVNTESRKVVFASSAEYLGEHTEKRGKQTGYEPTDMSPGGIRWRRAIFDDQVRTQ